MAPAFSEQDHPILRGAGRGSSFAEPQIATQLFTSSRRRRDLSRPIGGRRRLDAGLRREVLDRHLIAPG
ncbi:MAG TPA: hypothetical protein VGH70_07420 [Bradyrhizobium sp.]